MTAASELVTAYQARFSGHVQRQRSRQDDPANAGSVDTTKLTTAATDAIQQFQWRSGVAYDSTSDFHVQVGVNLMEYVLLRYSRAYESADRLLEKDIAPMMEGIKRMRSREMTVDAGTDLREVTLPSASLPPDLDPDGTYFDGFTRQSGASTDLEELHPF